MVAMLCCSRYFAVTCWATCPPLKGKGHCDPVQTPSDRSLLSNDETFLFCVK